MTMQEYTIMNRLPRELHTYIYKFIYPEVKLAHWSEKYGFHYIIRELINNYPEFYADIIYESINKHFTEDVNLLFNYFVIQWDNVDGRRLSWYEPLYEYPEDYFINSIVNTIVSILSSKPFDKSAYNVIASYIILINKDDDNE